MHRSASTSRFSDRYNDHHNYNCYYASSAASSKVSSALRALSLEDNELPVYQQWANKKEKTRAKFAENAVHLIPLVLMLCALILWLFSNPNIELRESSSMVIANMEGMIVEREVDSDGSGHTKAKISDSHSILVIK